MALDGITVAALRSELTKQLINGRLYKIAQPENDELLLTIKTEQGETQRLLISAGASLPFLYLTNQNKPSPMTAPNFCMLLRKHLQNGRITEIRQPSLERILMLDLEHLNEMGDLCKKTLVVELMGKHSNIIFIDQDNRIIDSIKHISSAVSSVREVLPGRDYFIPATQDKADPLTVSKDDFLHLIMQKNMEAGRALYMTFTGLSPVMSEEICHRAGISASSPVNELSEDILTHLYNHFTWLMDDIKSGQFHPNIVFKDQLPIEFGVFDFSLYKELTCVSYVSVSNVLEEFYAKKNVVTRIRQKSVDLRKIVTTMLERNVKKYDLQLKQLKDTEKKDKYKVYGELINTYGYSVEKGAKSFEADNYYTGERITIPLDDTLSPQENAKKYFEKYNKLKRTYEAVTIQAQETGAEIEHLHSVMNSLDIAVKEEDLTQIKEELVQSGYIRRKGAAKKVRVTSKPFHYETADGFHIYVGKNNFQNDELTFKFANGGDWWFHAKGIPGSHVVVKTEGRELPDHVYEDAAALAAYYSKGREQDKVEIDYLERKNVKKPNGSKPGFVVYYTNYSMVASPNISHLKQIED